MRVPGVCGCFHFGPEVLDNPGFAAVCDDDG